MNNFNIKSVLDNQKSRMEADRISLEFFRLVDSGAEIKTHKYADLFDMMNDDDFAKLKESIKLKGIMNPPVITENMEVIDGRNRIKAYMELEAEGYNVQYSTPFAICAYQATDEDIKQIVNGLNVERRHLNRQEKLKMASALIGAKADTRSKGAKRDAARRAKNAQTSQNCEDRVITEQKIALNQMVCDELGCSPRTATSEIKRAVEGMGNEVINGKHYTQSEAAEILTWLGDNPKPKKQKAKPTAKPQAKPIAVEPVAEESVEEPAKQFVDVERVFDLIDNIDPARIIDVINYCNEKIRGE